MDESDGNTENCVAGTAGAVFNDHNCECARMAFVCERRDFEKVPGDDDEVSERRTVKKMGIDRKTFYFLGEGGRSKPG